MPRVKRGVNARKKRAALLRYTKGYKWDRKSKERAAKEALLHAWTHAFRGRKEKKRVYRRLWNTQINAAARLEGLTYSKLISGMKKTGLRIDRKILADLAQHEPAAFKEIVKKISA